MPVLRIDKKLAYYPRKELMVKLKQMIEYLATQKDWVKQKDVCEKYNVNKIWVERLDKMGILYLKSKYYGYGTQGNYRYPATYFVKLINFKKAQKMFKKALTKPTKIVSREDQMADKLLDLLDQKEQEAGG